MQTHHNPLPGTPISHGDIVIRDLKPVQLTFFCFGAPANRRTAQVLPARRAQWHAA